MCRNEERERLGIKEKRDCVMKKKDNRAHVK